MARRNAFQPRRCSHLTEFRQTSLTTWVARHGPHLLPPSGGPEPGTTSAMILTLAFRNLFHDRIRLAVTLVGILFSIVLVAVQLGLSLGSSRMITNMIEK